MLHTRHALILVLPMMLACEAGEVGETDIDPGAVPVEERASAADASAIEADVAQVRDGWVTAAEAGDAATISALYADDARMIGVTGETSEGREAIQATLAEGLQGLSDLEVNSTDMVVGRDVVSDMGTFQQTFQAPDGPEQIVSGSYVVVLRRQDDGSWKIVHHLAALEPEPVPEGA